jgi:ABC-type transport system involved in multi-copper enzyme maturation permease subunit
MLRLFKIEINKLIQSRAFKVMLGLYMGVFSLFMFLLTGTFTKLRAEIIDALFKFDYNPFSFPDIWIITFYFAQYFTLLAAIIIVVIVVNEFDFRTARQHIIDGLSRWEIVFGKFIAVLTTAIIITVLVFLLGTLYGISNPVSNSPTGYATAIGYIFAFFIRTLGLLTFAMFFAFWIKRTGITIILFIVLHLGWIAAIIRRVGNEAIGEILPIGVFNRLLRTFKPDESLIQNYEQLTLTDIFLIAPTSQFVMAAIYIAVFVGLSYVVIRKNEFK